MEESQVQQPSGQSQEQSGGLSESQEQANDNRVAYESYQKVLSEKKSMQARLKEMEEKYHNLENQNLEKEKEKSGELVDHLKSQISKREADIKELEETMKKREVDNVRKWVSNSLKTSLMREGCEHIAQAMKLVDPNDLNALRVDENLNVEASDLEMLVERFKKDNPFLFASKKTSFQNATPAETPEVEFKNMSRKEKRDFLINKTKS